MNDKNLTSSRLNISVTKSSDYSPTRARSFKVKTTQGDYSQYVNTIKAYALAGMPFEHIANAGDALGDLVDRIELDAPIQENWKQTIGEIAEDEGKIMAWQSRGEVISISRQLPQTTTVTGTEVVSIQSELTTLNQEKKIDVVEGIAVISKNDSQLQNNIYLRAPADLFKK